MRVKSVGVEHAAPKANTNDRALMRGIRVGDVDSFRKLYERHVRSVYQYCYSICRTGHRAEDASQEVWAALWRARTKVELATESALPWLLVTARYKSLNKLSDDAKAARAAESASIALSAAPDPVDIAGARELHAHIQKVVRALPLLDQQIFHLCVDGDETYNAAARTLGVRPSVLRNRLSRIRSRIRVNLTQYGAQP